MERIPAKTIVSAAKSTAWFGIDYNMNIYRGCCHGCIYCDSRSECYRIEDFRRVRAKANALDIIRSDLSRKRRTGVVGTGAMSDPYNPFERLEKLTRGALALLDEYGFGVAIATKSDLIVRDIDLLQAISSHSPVLCKLTITTASDAQAARFEPHAPSSSLRFAALERLSAAGLFAGVLLMPVLPFLEDSTQNIVDIVRLAADCGARFVYPSFGVTLRDTQREYFYRALDRLYPDEPMRAKYHRQFGASYSCASPRAGALWPVFRRECESRGLLYRMEEIVAAYRRQSGGQLSLF